MLHNSTKYLQKNRSGFDPYGKKVPDPTLTGKWIRSYPYRKIDPYLTLPVKVYTDPTLKGKTGSGSYRYGKTDPDPAGKQDPDPTCCLQAPHSMRQDLPSCCINFKPNHGRKKRGRFSGNILSAIASKEWSLVLYLGYLISSVPLIASITTCCRKRVTNIVGFSALHAHCARMKTKSWYLVLYWPRSEGERILKNFWLSGG